MESNFCIVHNLCLWVTKDYYHPVRQNSSDVNILECYFFYETRFYGLPTTTISPEVIKQPNNDLVGYILLSNNSKYQLVNLLGTALQETDEIHCFFVIQHYDRCRVPDRPILRGATSGWFKSIGGTMLYAAARLSLRQSGGWQRGACRSC